MSNQKKTTIRPVEDYTNTLDPEVASVATTVVGKLTGNSRYPKPPVDLDTLKTTNESFLSLIAESRDGSKSVIARKNATREEVIKMLRLLGRYVEIASNGDMATFTTSGFEPASQTHTPPQYLSQNIRSIDHGNSGQLLIRLRAVPQAASYEVRYAPIVNGTDGAWTQQPSAGVRKPVLIDGLTPGTNYSIQVRSLSASGYTDWSDSITCICK